MSDRDSLLEFPPFRLDIADQRLWRDERAIELRPKTFAVLKYLAERPGKLVRNDELLDAVWQDAAVTPGTLNTSIRELRKALGDDARQPSYIETVHRRGFRFVAPVHSSIEGATEETETPHASSLPVIPGTGKLHGREEVLELLEARLASAMEGKRQVVFVTGDVGIGKTSVVRELVERHGDARLRTVRGQCVQQHGEGEAYHPVLDALERLMRTDGPAFAKASARPGPDRLPDIMRRFAPTWVLQLPWLLESDELSELRATVGTVTTARMLREFCVMIETFTRDQPLILVLEDMHWSDPATLDLVGAIARRSDAARLFLIATYRPVDAAMAEHPITPLNRKLQQERVASALPLPPLTEANVASYLRERFDWRQVHEGLAGVIHEQTDGNPLLMVTLTSHLVSKRMLTQEDGAWGLRVPAEVIAAGAPEGLQEIVDEHLESLTREEREAFEVASVVGETFSVQSVAAALDVDAEHLEATLTRLAQVGHFIEESGEARWRDGTHGRQFEFQHNAFRRILYGRLSPARRRELHVRIAARLEAAFAQNSDNQAASLAVHYEQGGDIARAVEHLARAAAFSRRRVAPREAASYARRAIELLRATARGGLRDARELELSVKLGQSVAALCLTSSETESLLERSIELSRQLGTLRAALGSEREHGEATVAAAVDRLPDEEKEAVLLHCVSGLPYSEIARVSTTPRAAVASGILRGLGRLGDDLESSPT